MEPETSVREMLAFGAAVERVADDRQTLAREMEADLMAAAGLRDDRDQREIANAPHRFDDGVRGAAGAFGISAGGIADDHLARILRMMRDRRVDGDFALEGAGHQGFVAARDPAGANRVAQF